MAAEPRQVWWRQPGWQAWLHGAWIAILLQLFFIGSYVTWFIRMLCHEIGHCAMALATGHLAIPVIKIQGDACAVHGPRLLPLALAMLVAAAAMAWRSRAAPRLSLPWALAVGLLLPALFWEGLRSSLFLAGGHAGELAFAVVFLWRAWTGGFAGHAMERLLYAALGWVFVWKNAALGIGLVASDAAVREYRRIDSFGLVNDLLRLAEELWQLPLAVPALLLALAAPAAPVVAWWLAARPPEGSRPAARRRETPAG